MKKKFTILCMAFISMAMAATIAACSDKDAPDTPDTPKPDTPVVVEPIKYQSGDFAKGADISWVTEFESQGSKFYTPGTHQEKELTKLLRDDCGVNAIRLRVWVNPTDGWCNIQDVVVKARRAHDLDMGIMIDFHFSDWWADPGKQNIPAAWADMNLEQVYEAIKAHVTETLTELARYGISPEWVQIGNETRTGMMWPLGSLDNGDNFTKMVNAGYDAVKAKCPDAIVIVHCDNGHDAWLYNNLFGKLKDEGAKYDMIGMSLYPEPNNWQKLVSDCMSTVEMVQSTYGKPVMICEVGFTYDQPAIANQMMTKLFNECKARDVKGIFWWEPETPVSHSYKKGCFNAKGEPTEALDVFKNN